MYCWLWDSLCKPEVLSCFHETRHLSLAFVDSSLLLCAKGQNSSKIPFFSVSLLHFKDFVHELYCPTIEMNSVIQHLHCNIIFNAVLWPFQCT